MHPVPPVWTYTTPATIYSVRLGEILLRGNGEQPQLGGISQGLFPWIWRQMWGTNWAPWSGSFLGSFLLIGLTRSHWYNTFERIPMDFSKFWSDIPLFFGIRKKNSTKLGGEFPMTSRNRKDTTKKLLPKKENPFVLYVLTWSWLGTPWKSPALISFWIFSSSCSIFLSR